MAAVVTVSGAAVDEYCDQESVGEPAEPGDVHRPRRRRTVPGAHQTELPSTLTSIPLRLGGDNVMHGPPSFAKIVWFAATPTWGCVSPAMCKTYHWWMALATNFWQILTIPEGGWAEDFAHYNAAAMFIQFTAIIARTRVRRLA